MVLVCAKDGGGLFRPSDDPQHAPPKAGPARQRGTPAKKSRTVYPTANAAVAELERRHGPKTAWWKYHNADGEPVFVVVRFPLPPDPDNPDAKPAKTVRPVSRVNGRWIIGDPPGLLPLYQIPDLLASRSGAAGLRVYVTEGEKTADAARAVGLVKAGWGVRESDTHGPKGGRPVQRFRLLHGTDTDTTDAKLAKNVGSVSVSAVSDAGESWRDL